MKKIFTCLAVLISVFSFNAAAENQKTFFDQKNSFLLAKAVKLGRGKSSLLNADTLLATGSESTIGKKCDSDCLSCNTANGTCLSCPTNYIPSGSGCSKCPTGTYSAGDVCLKCASPGNGTCNGCYPPGQQPDCYDLVCDEGYVKDGDSCMEVTCDDYYRKSGSTCVANCTGVTCKSGYTATATLEGCCCQIDTSCQSGYSYNTTYQSCIKDTYTCNSGCNVNGCGIGSTLKPDTGYYIKSDGTCPACSTAIAGCAECSISKLGTAPVCTKCNTGYTLSNGKCLSSLIEITPGSSGCSGNLQDCGDTGCCPTTYSCSYYAQKAASGIAMCLKTATTQDVLAQDVY